MFCALQPEGRRFKSTSSHCVATLDKLLTHIMGQQLVQVVCEECNGKPPHSSHLAPGSVKFNEPAFGQR